MINFFRKISSRTLVVLVATILALPLSWKGITGFSVWLSPYIMLNSLFALKSLVWLNYVSLTILVGAVVSKRWFCRYACPAGWVLDKTSSLNCRRNFLLRKVIPVGEWLAVISLAASFFGMPLFVILDPLVIFNGFFTLLAVKFNWWTLIALSGFPLLVLLNFIYPGLWCAKLCPLGGLQTILYGLKKQLQGMITKKSQVSSPEPGRRFFLASGAGLIAGWVTSPLLSTDTNSPLRPPAALTGHFFHLTCIRCGNCIKACPTKILQQQVTPGTPLAWMTPEVTFKHGYCIESCNICSQVCPSGAITPFHPEAKKEIVMGLAKINLDKCLLTENTECDRCKAVCPYKALDILSAGQSALMKPEVDETKCVGCGACQAICPVLTIQVVPANRRSFH